MCIKFANKPNLRVLEKAMKCPFFKLSRLGGEKKKETKKPGHNSGFYNGYWRNYPPNTNFTG
jgi:hypothetical protein